MQSLQSCVAGSTGGNLKQFGSSGLGLAGGSAAADFGAPVWHLAFEPSNVAPLHGQAGLAATQTRQKGCAWAFKARQVMLPPKLASNVKILPTAKLIRAQQMTSDAQGSLHFTQLDKLQHIMSRVCAVEILPDVGMSKGWWLSTEGDEGWQYAGTSEIL